MGVAGTMFVFSRGQCGAGGIGPRLIVSLCKDVQLAAQPAQAPGLVCASGWVRWVNFHTVIPIEFVRINISWSRPEPREQSSRDKSA
jgi:hypothetical protein